jgi:hypothetical protein
VDKPNKNDDTNKTDDEQPDDGCVPYPGPDVPDPAPWLGQVGEGATERSGEAIARAIRKLTHPRSDARMPVPDPKKR